MPTIAVKIFTKTLDSTKICSIVKKDKKKGALSPPLQQKKMIVNSFSRSFDDLILNPYYQLIQEQRPFTQAESLILDWLRAYPSGRSYPDLMWDCRLELAECLDAIDELMELGVLRWR